MQRDSLCSKHVQPPLLPASLIRVVHLFKLITTYIKSPTSYIKTYIKLTQSPQFILRFALGVVHSMELDKCIMTFTSHYSIMLSIFTTLKILCVPPIHLLQAQHTHTHTQDRMAADPFTISLSFAFSIMSDSW